MALIQTIIPQDDHLPPLRNVTQMRGMRKKRVMQQVDLRLGNVQILTPAEDFCHVCHVSRGIEEKPAIE